MYSLREPWRFVIEPLRSMVHHRKAVYWASCQGSEILHGQPSHLDDDRPGTDTLVRISPIERH